MNGCAWMLGETKDKLDILLYNDCGAAVDTRCCLNTGCVGPKYSALTTDRFFVSTVKKLYSTGKVAVLTPVFSTTEETRKPHAFVSLSKS